MYDDKKSTPLPAAPSKSSPYYLAKEVIEMVLTKNVDINIKNENGMSLTEIVRKSQLDDAKKEDFIALLVSKGAAYDKSLCFAILNSVEPKMPTEQRALREV